MTLAWGGKPKSFLLAQKIGPCIEGSICDKINLQTDGLYEEAIVWQEINFRKKPSNLF